jgi:hypothetical protein
VRVFAKDYFQKLLAKYPILQALCSDVLRWLLLQIESDVIIWIEAAGILRI